MTHVLLRPVLRQMARLGAQGVTDRVRAMQSLATARGLRYIDDRGRPRTIEVALVPWLVTPAQMAFFHRISAELTRALLRVPQLYAQRPDARRILRLEPRQDEWMTLARPSRRPPWAVLGRLDATAIFDRSNWRQAFSFLEPNAVGVGGLHYAPAACDVSLEVMGDLLRSAYPGRRIRPMPDPRRLLLAELRGVCRQLGTKLTGLALLENREYTTGTDEFSHLAKFYSGLGLKAVVADPRDLRWRGSRLTAKGSAVDVIYRDCELNEFVEIEAAGRPLRALREAIRQGRLISALPWEFDHKSCWELFTDHSYARAFTASQRRLFATLLPWTRLVREAKVEDPSGRRVDLPSYIRRHRRQLVLKPNMLYGGQGVVVGSTVSQRTWERSVASALRGRRPYVVQRLAKIATHPFPDPDGGARQRHVVSGFFFSSNGIGLVGRFSRDPVVNVSRGGGLVPALMIS